ncbi:MAG: hypothetical protein HY050_06735 [Actinobacteria bacterium]|nr:hypothetical protein [Actinomycetota bacterium]
MRIRIWRPKSGLRQEFRRGSVAVIVLALIAILIPPQAQATLTVFGPFPIMTATYGVGTVKIIHPTTNSPGKWSYTSSNANVATVSGETLKVLSVGTTTITATQAASGNYTARSRSTQLRVSPGTPTVGSFPPQSVQITEKIFTLTAPTSQSDGDWSFTSADPKIATVLGNKVTLLDGGAVLITATQRPTINWVSVSTTMTLTIIANKPVLGPFGSITIMKDSVASVSLVAPTSNSTGAWTFASSNPAVARLVGNVVTPLAFGSTVITATQSAIGSFSSASASMTLTIKGTSPTIGSFPDATTAYEIVTSHTVTLTPPTSNSTGLWSFTSSDTSVATISGSTVAMLKPGKTTITATQAASSTYGPSDPVIMTFTVTGAPTLGAWNSIEKVVRDPDFTLDPPTSNSPGLWSFASDNSSVIEIVGNIAKVKGAGLAKITATQAATQFFTAATSQIAVRVYGAIPTLGTFAPIEGGVGDLAITIKPPASNSTGAWVFTSSNTKVAVVTGDTLKIVGVGVATLTATQRANGIYSQSNTVQTTVTGREAAVVGDFANLKIVYGTIAPTLVLPKSSSAVPWVFQSSNPAVVTFSGSIIQMRGIGTAIITATQAATSTSAAVKRTFTIQVLVPTGPSPTPKPTSTAKPTTKPTSGPTTKPGAPGISVALSPGAITVVVTAASAKVSIDGVTAKVGKNKVKPGLHIVIVTISGKIVFSKTYNVK